MTITLLLFALLVIAFVGIRVGSKGEAGTIAAAVLTVGAVVAGMSTFA